MQNVGSSVHDIETLSVGRIFIITVQELLVASNEQIETIDIGWLISNKRADFCQKML